MARVPIGLELFSVRNELAEDTRRHDQSGRRDGGTKALNSAGPPRQSRARVERLS